MALENLSDVEICNRFFYIRHPNKFDRGTAPLALNTWELINSHLMLSKFFEIESLAHLPFGPNILSGLEVELFIIIDSVDDLNNSDFIRLKNFGGYKSSHYFILVQCNFNKLELDKNLLSMIHKGHLSINNLAFVCCNIEYVKFTASTNNPLEITHFHKCQISNFLSESAHSLSDFTLNGNDSIIKLLKSRARILQLDSLKIGLLWHTDLGEPEITLTNCNFFYSQDAIQNIESDKYQGAWNTLTYLSNHSNSIESEKQIIEKYIHFFSANVSITGSKIKKFLFNFHGGYFNLLYPALATIAFALVNYLLVKTAIPQIEAPAIKAIYLIEQLKDVILKDFHLSLSIRAISLPKLLLCITGPAFTFSLFCLANAIRKLFGFKIKE